MRLIGIAIVAVIWVAGVNGQQVINLSGKITNGFGGSPIAGATVKITSRNLTDVSAVDGSYHLYYSSGIVLSAGNTTQKSRCKIIGNKLKFVLDNGDRFGAELFDIKGRCAWKASVNQQGAIEKEIKIPFEMLSGQTGLLRVTLGAERRYYKFLNGDQRHFFTSPWQAAPTAVTAKTEVSSLAAAAGTLTILDTLVAAKAGLSRNGTIHIYVYTFIDTIDVSLGEQDTFSEGRQQCVHRINTYRDSMHVAHLTRSPPKEFCVDTQAMLDYTSNTAHSAFGHCSERGQCECPGWSGTTLAAAVNSIVTGCLQSMWNEGPGGGHYEIMKSTSYTKVECGFYYIPSKRIIWATQDYWP